MTAIDKKVVATYNRLLAQLSPGAKIGLIQELTKSLQNDIKLQEKKMQENSESTKSEKEKRKKFFATFGAFKDEDAFENIKSHRKFRKKNLSF